MSGSKSLSIIFDDKRGDSIALSGAAPWTAHSADQWFNGSIQSPDYALKDKTKLGTLEMKFSGTSVALFGTTPPSSSSQSMIASIDGRAPYKTSYDDPNPQTYRQWYQTPQLSEGTHDLFLSNIAGTAFDFAVVTVGQNTPLAGQTVIVDNDDPAFTFEGKWRRSQEQFNSGPNPDGNPYGNTTHVTTYVGDTFTYRFSGISIAIYSIFTWSNIGLITLSFTLDGGTTSRSYRVTADTTQFKAEIGQQQNFPFFSFDFLTSGDHTLVVNVTECVNQTFALDYITYTPNFATLAEMPVLAPVTASGTAPSSSSSSKKSNAGAIAGGVIGVLLLLSLLAGLFVFLRRRKQSGQRAGEIGSGSKAKYTPLAFPFLGRPQAEGTDIPLAHQTQFSPPHSASTSNYHPDMMARMQMQTPYNTAENDPFTAYTGLGPDHRTIRAQESSGTMGSGYTQHQGQLSRNPTTSDDRATARNTYRTTGVFSNEAEYGEAEPPSYDDVTGGQPPTHISYVVER